MSYDTMDLDSSASTIIYTLDQVLPLHKLAAENLAFIWRRVRSENMPSLRSVYLETAQNDIARAGFVARPKLDKLLNDIIFHYSLDVAHSFNANLNQVRINLNLAVIVWCMRSIGIKDSKFEASSSLMYSYILAWLESISRPADFSDRGAFLDAWNSSKYDLTWFTKWFKVTMEGVLAELAYSKPPVAGDPTAFINMCSEKKILREEFERKKAKKEREDDMLGNAMEKRGVEVDMDFDGDMPSIPGGVDLRRVPWHADWMQALLNIDKTIEVSQDRPKSDRKEWISQQEGYDLLFPPKTDELADESMEKLCLW